MSLSMNLILIQALVWTFRNLRQLLIVISILFFNISTTFAAGQYVRCDALFEADIRLSITPSFIKSTEVAKTKAVEAAAEERPTVVQTQLDIKAGMLISRYEPRTDLDTPVVPVELSIMQTPDYILKKINGVLANNKTLISFPKNSFISVHLSLTKHLEIATKGLTSEQHSLVIVELNREKIIDLLSGIPDRLRIKYLHIRTDSTGKPVVTFDLMRDLPVKYASHAQTGFGSQASSIIRPFHRNDLTNEKFQIRHDLIEQETWQEAYTTCALASLCQVLGARGTKIGEAEMVARASQVKPEAAIFTGTDLGMTLDQVQMLTDKFQQQHSNLIFKTTEVRTVDDAGINKFRDLVRLSTNSSNGVDLIVNFYSPKITRPGAGHYTPVGGYDPATDMVLISEVNRTVNERFWVSLPTLYAAIVSDAKSPRGYVVAEKHRAANWEQNLTRLVHKVSSPLFSKADLNANNIKTLSELGLTKLDLPADRSEIYALVTSKARGHSPIIAERVIQEYGKNVLPNVARALDPMSVEHSANHSSDADRYDLFRGYGFLLLPRNDKVFNDKTFMAELLVQRGQTASGYVRFDPNNTAKKFDDAFAKLSEHQPYGVKPIAFTLTGSDGNNLFLQIATWVTSLRKGQKTDGKILVMENSYAGGRGPLRDFLFFDRTKDAPGADLIIKSPLTTKPPDANDLNLPLNEAEIASLAQIEKVYLERGDIGGILVEPVLAAAHVYYYRTNFLAELTKLCDRLNIPILADEVFTGGGRTGKAFAFQHYPGFVPNFVSFGKGLGVAGLAQVEASAGQKFNIKSLEDQVKQSPRKYGIQSRTYFKIFDATIDNTADALLKSSMIINRIVNDHLIENAQVSGAYLLQAARWFKGVFLGGHKNKSVTDDVRGLGTMIAVDNKRYQPPITLKKVDVETMIRERVLEVLKNKLARANQLPNEFSHRKEASDIIQGLNDFTPFNEFLSEATKARTLLAEVDDYSIPLFPNK